jgi:hypothetical protein
LRCSNSPEREKFQNKIKIYSLVEIYQKTKIRTTTIFFRRRKKPFITRFLSSGISIANFFFVRVPAAAQAAEKPRFTVFVNKNSLTGLPLVVKKQ